MQRSRSEFRSWQQETYGLKSNDPHRNQPIVNRADSPKLEQAAQELDTDTLSEKRRYKSCHWGCTFSKGALYAPKGCILVHIST